MKKCPYCAEDVANNTKVCPHCWEAINFQQEKKHSNGSRYMNDNEKNILRNIWCIVSNIIMVWIISSIYSAIYESFEIIAISILVLIYTNLNAFIFYRKLQKAEELRNNMLHENKDNKSEAEAKVQRMKRVFYVNKWFTILVYIIALYNILDNIG